MAINKRLLFLALSAAKSNYQDALDLPFYYRIPDYMKGATGQTVLVKVITMMEERDVWDTMMFYNELSKKAAKSNDFPEPENDYFPTPDQCYANSKLIEELKKLSILPRIKFLTDIQTILKLENEHDKIFL